jgi:hypothetical protein
MLEKDYYACKKRKIVEIVGTLLLNAKYVKELKYL